MTGGKRTVLLVAHTGRPRAVTSARFAAARLAAAGLEVRVLAPEAGELRCAAEVVPPGVQAAAGAEIVIVIGGDGTLLRAAEIARPARAPLLGVNLGHVGFLAEADPDDLAEMVDRVVARQYQVESRMTIDVTVRQNGSVAAETWALNEATVEKTPRVGMLELVTEVDGRPLSRLDCDGVICATPTGSTAYAFSAGGPIVWPEVEALLLVPICAHALFAGPMVVAPDSRLAVEVIGGTPRAPVGPVGLGMDPGSWRGEMTGAVLWCDGRRNVDLLPGARVEVRRGALPVLLAGLHGHRPGRSPAAVGAGAPFTDRLVVKFGLPVTGWRGRQARTPGPSVDGRTVAGERELAGGAQGTSPTPGTEPGAGEGPGEQARTDTGTGTGKGTGANARKAPGGEEVARADA
jgi:NAD+ kinase